MKSRLTVAAVAALGAGVALAGPFMVDSADRDGDGLVTLEEFRASHLERIDEHFARMDTDADGSLTSEEIHAAAQARRAEHQKWREHHHRKAGKHVDRMVERLDVDGSGSLSLTEMEDARRVPSAEEFYAADANGDAELDGEEIRGLMRQHHEQMRAGKDAPAVEQ